ncbi:hypothetical protein [Pasteurella multocida]|uniref:hypothetical protein n=1 Tax=Pasteurella multocida TaxID=747 RepID=UPI0018988B3A|nr:hypothetical protein [Pasteurella multocida]MBF6983824.1 hypothetical protein [Pasteurella multocida]MDA5607154.1 hypothetical protein [Pasteurella multocida subsp. multocida]MDA5614906.1 hypothetical protein [Pasteurella multocida]MDA5624825.1 hypothetical protein [Pasteurella multocida]
MQGRLLLGVPFNGAQYFDFNVKILTLGLECQALEWIEEKGLAKDELNKAEQTLVDLAYLCQQLEISGIDKVSLTPEFLLDNLSTDDYVLITDLIGQLRKKCIDVGENQVLATV